MGMNPGYKGAFIINDFLRNQHFNRYLYLIIVNNTGVAPCTSTEFKCQEQVTSVQARSSQDKSQGVQSRQSSSSSGEEGCKPQSDVNDDNEDCDDKSDEFGI